MEYVCKIGSNTGQVVTRLEQATSEAALRQRLVGEGYLVFSIQSRGGLGATVMTRRQKKIKPDDFLVFNQQFLTLSKSGLSLQKSIDLLVAQTRTDELREALEGVREQIRGGKLLSEAFEAVGRFPKVYCATLRAGERSGSLDKVLAHYVAYQKTSRGFRKKFLSALIYPAFLVAFLFGLITFVVMFVVPRFALLYNDLGVELPAMTVFVISFSKNLNRLIVPILIGLGAVVAGVRSAFRRENTRLAWDRFKFKLPLLGPLLLKFSVAEFARTLSTLLQGGLPIIMALKTTVESVSSPLVARALEAARREVLGGQSLYHSLKANVVFPPMALDMIEVGESTGALPAMLENLSEFYEEDVAIDLGTLVSLVDPIMLGIIAIVVAFILIAFYLPMFELASQMH
ncbi:MAG: type II secretion system F family protein [Terriglobia bacterium]